APPAWTMKIPYVCVCGIGCRPISERAIQPGSTPGIQPKVGAGLLANAVDQPPSSATDTPLSRASPLPQF
ncbi:hypothetical protein FE76_14730, partial [Staphylococcus aureus]